MGLVGMRRWGGGDAAHLVDKVFIRKAAAVDAVPAAPVAPLKVAALQGAPGAWVRACVFARAAARAACVPTPALHLHKRQQAHKHMQPLGHTKHHCPVGRGRLHHPSCWPNAHLTSPHLTQHKQAWPPTWHMKLGMILWKVEPL